MTDRERVEQQVARIWADALGLETVNVADDFLDLGGDSVAATQVIVGIWDTFGIEVAFDELFEGRTVSSLVSAYFPNHD